MTIHLKMIHENVDVEYKATSEKLLFFLMEEKNSKLKWVFGITVEQIQYAFGYLKVVIFLYNSTFL